MAAFAFAFALIAANSVDDFLGHIEKPETREHVFNEDASSTMAWSCCVFLFRDCSDDCSLAVCDDTVIFCQLVLRYLAR